MGLPRLPRARRPPGAAMLVREEFLNNSELPVRDKLLRPRTARTPGKSRSPRFMASLSLHAVSSRSFYLHGWRRRPWKRRAPGSIVIGTRHCRRPRLSVELVSTLCQVTRLVLESKAY